MNLAVTLAIHLLLAAGGECYFVGNTRILPLPSCEIGPATIEDLTEDPGPAKVESLRGWRPGPAAGADKSSARWARPTIVVRGNEELERRLAVALQQRIEAVAGRLAAERQRDVALRQRAAALRELAATRRALASARARGEHASGRQVPASDGG